MEILCPTCEGAKRGFDDAGRRITCSFCDGRGKVINEKIETKAEVRKGRRPRLVANTDAAVVR